MEIEWEMSDEEVIGNEGQRKDERTGHGEVKVEGGHRRGHNE